MKILIADDNQDYLKMIGALITMRGHTPFLAADGKEAREILDSERVDMILSDVFMPTLDGVRFHSYVREFREDQDTPFVFVSGFDDEYTANAVVNSDVDFFISKARPIDELLALIDKINLSGQLKSV